MVIYCYVTNRPNTQWLKTTAIIYVTHASVSGAGFGREGLSLFHVVSARVAQLELRDPRPRWHTPMAGKLVLASQEY